MARKSKYSGIVSNLPKLPTVEPGRRDIVEAVKTEILAPAKEDDPAPEARAAASGGIHDTLDSIDEGFKHLVQLETRATVNRHWSSEFARVYAELRMIRDRITRWDSSISVLLDAYTELMLDQFENEGITSIHVNGQPVSTWLEPYAQVTNKEELRLWCLTQGLERSMHLSWQTLNSLTKQMLIRGEAEPDGVKTYAKHKIRLGAGDDD